MNIFNWETYIGRYPFPPVFETDNFQKSYFCNQNVGVKYCVIGMWIVSVCLDGGKMQELAITKEYYEELKEQIRTALGEKYFSGVQVQRIQRSWQSIIQPISDPHLMIIGQCIIGMSMDLLKLRGGRFQKGFTMHCR